MAEDYHRPKSKRPVEQPLGVWLIILWQGLGAAIIPIVFIVISVVKPSTVQPNSQDPWILGYLAGNLIVLGICIAASLRFFWARYVLAGLVAYGCVVKLYLTLSLAADGHLISPSGNVFSSLVLSIPFRLIITIAAVVYLLAGTSSKRFFSRRR